MNKEQIKCTLVARNEEIKEKEKHAKMGDMVFLLLLPAATSV